MASLTLTAAALATPRAACAAEEDVYAYVQDLLAWKAVLREPWAHVCLRESVVQTLLDDGLYPLGPELTRLLAQFAIDAFDAKTVVAAATGLLERAGSFESFFGVGEFVVEPCEFRSSPDLLAPFDDVPEVQQDLRQSASLVVLLKTEGAATACDHVLVVRPAPVSSLVEVHTLVHCMELSDGTLVDCSDRPCCTTIPVSSSFDEWFVNIDEVELWQSAKESAVFMMAAKLHALKLLREVGGCPVLSDLPAFRFHARFLRSVTKCNPGKTGTFVRSVLRAMSETLLERNMPATHSLRVAQGGGSPQRVRGKDKAWRRDIDYEYHLHYWLPDGGDVEFAHIGPHNDFTIPD